MERPKYKDEVIFLTKFSLSLNSNFGEFLDLDVHSNGRIG
jgi:hypothetical protein